MTTIAWDGKTLAGDTQTNRGEMRNFVDTKVYGFFSGDARVLFGGSGDEGICIEVMNWVANGAVQSDKPPLEEDSFNGILVDHSGAYRLNSDLVPIKLMEPFHAIGSGRDLAMSAMHLGCDAVKAVEIAATYNIFTGGKITSVTRKE